MESGVMASNKPTRLQVVMKRVSCVFRRALPHAALMLIYLSYLAIGGFAFCALEHGDMDKYNDDMNRTKNEFMDMLADMEAENMTTEERQQQIKDELDKYSEVVMVPHWKEGRIQSARMNRTFTFASSMLFCMTTITTIGYGDIVPTTKAGRGFCIIYALIGIPLTLLCLADIGDLLARLVIWGCIKLRITKCTRRIKEECSRSKPGDDFQMDESNLHSGQLSTDLMQSKEKNYTKHQMEAESQTNMASTGGPSHMQPHKAGGVCTKEGSCQEEVPVFIILLILVTYICGVSWVIMEVEDWDYGEAVYFVIITLTTIGFGDYVPTYLYSHQAFLSCIFFTLLGMAMMSMTIALLKQKIIRSFGYLYKKFNG